MSRGIEFLSENHYWIEWIRKASSLIFRSVFLTPTLTRIDTEQLPPLCRSCSISSIVCEKKRFWTSLSLGSQINRHSIVVWTCFLKNINKMQTSVCLSFIDAFLTLFSGDLDIPMAVANDRASRRPPCTSPLLPGLPLATAALPKNNISVIHSCCLEKCGNIERDRNSHRRPTCLEVGGVFEQ